MGKKVKLIDIVMLELSVVVYSLSTVAANMASKQEFLSLKYILFFGLDFCILGVYAVPEYNIMKANGNTSGTADKDGFSELISGGELGKGTFLGYTFTLDDTAPVIKDAVVDEEAGTVTVTLSDNNYVALLLLSDITGAAMYGYGLPEQTEKNEEIKYMKIYIIYVKIRIHE